MQLLNLLLKIRPKKFENVNLNKFNPLFLFTIRINSPQNTKNLNDIIRFTNNLYSTLTIKTHIGQQNYHLRETLSLETNEASQNDVVHNSLVALRTSLTRDRRSRL